MFGTNEADAPKIEGRTLECQFCKSTRFKLYEVRLHITPRSMFHVPIGGLVGKAYVCRACGYRHEFYPPG